MKILAFLFLFSNLLLAQGGVFPPSGGTSSTTSDPTVVRNNSTSLQTLAGPISAPQYSSIFVTTAFPQTVNAFSQSTFALNSKAYAGGRNFYNDKTNFNTYLGSFQHYTDTQDTGSFDQYYSCYGNGDCVGYQIENYSFGGPDTLNDEGNEVLRLVATEGGQVFLATLAANTTDADGSQTITTSSQVQNGTQGEGRLLIDLSKVYNAGYLTLVQQGAATANHTIQVTCGGACNWDSTFGASVQTTLSADVANVVAGTNSFPRSALSLTVASSTGFSAGAIACVWDYDYECEKVSSVPDSTHIVLAIVRKPHPTGSWVTTGGLAGYAMDLEADRITPGTLNGGITMPINTGTPSSIVRSARPIMMSSAGNIASLFPGAQKLPGNSEGLNTRAYVQMGSAGTASGTAAAGALTALTCSGGSGYSTSVDKYNNPSNPPQVIFNVSQWTTVPTAHVSTINVDGTLGACSIDTAGTGALTTTPTVMITPSNPYDIYPAAKVWQVYNASTSSVDGTFWTQPFSGSITVGDQLEQPHYFEQQTKGGFIAVGTLLPASTQANVGAFTQFGGPFQGSDQGSNIANTNKASAYAGAPTSNPWVVGAGQLGTPIGYNLQGPWAAGLRMDTPPFGGVFKSHGSAAVYIECGTGVLTCASWTNGYAFLEGRNFNGASDALLYNPFSMSWSLSAGSTKYDGAGGVCTLGFSITGLNVTGTSCSVKGAALQTNGASVFAPYWGLSGLTLATAGVTLHDTTSSGTVSFIAANGFSQAALAADSTTTYTRAYGTFVNKPAAGTNVTIGHSFSLGLNGDAYLNGVLMSITASNTDLVGELTLAAATTASYSFTGSYVIHPECQLTPQFDIGSGNRMWITYPSAASFTINFSTAVTGTVSYSCVGRT